MIKYLESILSNFGLNLHENWERFILFILILLFAFLCQYIFLKIILKSVGKIVSKTKAKWDDVIFDNNVMIKLSRIISPIIITALLPSVLSIDSTIYIIVQKVVQIALILTSVMFLSELLSAIYNASHSQEKLKNKPLKGLLQIIQVILYFIAIIIIIGIIINKSPMMLLTTLGASAAVLMLVFKDSILGFVAGIQLSANKMLQVGDWISMPKYGADGNVIEVSLNTVKVRNWDNTIVTIPPYALISDSFQNWRGMSESGGRRIKRSINIDMTSVKFCTPQMIKKYKEISLLKDYLAKKEKEIDEYNTKNNVDENVLVNGRRQTNIGVFRAYLTSYLNNKKEINNNLTCMVRQLQPTDTGIPIELYFFSKIKDWVEYESIQADVFDHVLAVIPQFDLRVFQNPSGYDIQKIQN